MRTWTNFLYMKSAVKLLRVLRTQSRTCHESPKIHPAHQQLEAEVSVYLPRMQNRLTTRRQPRFAQTTAITSPTRPPQQPYRRSPNWSRPSHLPNSIWHLQSIPLLPRYKGLYRNPHAQTSRRCYRIRRLSISGRLLRSTCFPCSISPIGKTNGDCV